MLHLDAFFDIQDLWYCKIGQDHKVHMFTETDSEQKDWVLQSQE